jgi:hypothetical protein
MDSTMVDVFKTDVSKKGDAKELLELLIHHFPGAEINFDLQDKDNILRVRTTPNDPALVIQLLSNQGFFCAELD